MKINKADLPIGNPNPPCGKADTAFFLDLLRRQVPAAPFIDKPSVAPMRGGCGVQFGAGAEARVQKSLFAELFKVNVINRRPVGLTVPMPIGIRSAFVPIQP